MIHVPFNRTFVFHPFTQAVGEPGSFDPSRIPASFIKPHISRSLYQLQLTPHMIDMWMELCMYTISVPLIDEIHDFGP